MPAPTPKLPIHEKRDAIAEAIRRHQVVVVSGDTGSGKTTQLPQMCHEALQGKGLIGCTQPRRVAAVSLAKRVAEECRCKLGELVGVQVRFLDQTSETTRIKFMTDGILLAETRGDRQLRKYDAIIVDEAHERTLNIDFTLGYLHNLLERRRDLKVIISSATLDVERFSKFFRDAPIIEIEGRTFPVEDTYLPAESSREDLASHVTRGVESIRETDRQGDILVFLPGEREIQETADLLTGQQFPKTQILPLYARLSLKDQQGVFKSSPGQQRIVLATNVAETSITIPSIVYVIDSGLARINRYDARTHIQRLLTERISKASARQRRGRCGRVSNGVCVRLYDEDDFERRTGFTDPEIRRTSLAGVILQMKSLRLPPIEDFP
ncbi:helicase-related protein, partial [Verrucomicrobiales bacterium]|nr:helicase-related protein [Verrucomicrobiales bacterium]